MYNDNRREQNLIISSPSVYTVLAEIQQGAKQRSLQEMDEALHLAHTSTRDSCYNLSAFFTVSSNVATLRFV